MAIEVEKDPKLRVKALGIVHKLGRLGWISPFESYRNAEDRALVAWRNFRTIGRIQRRRAALEGADLGGEA